MRRIAFQGIPGAFSEAAALRLWGSCEPLPQASFTSVVEVVESGAALGGVLPIENSIAGQVSESLAALRGSRSIEISDRLTLPVRLHLLGLPGATQAQVRRVASHPIALAQCSEFLASLGDSEITAWFDTAGAARDVARAGDPCFAAIAGQVAGEHYGLRVLAFDVHNPPPPENVTEFVAIRRRP
ncbi:MAG TPA: prephenate dehydratase domain-containing protein [Gemmatimonadales bacterium]|jgi:prephenate dehydratase|nr:prephenate dehydratase domain-containing protein [Gemmatimonadales bacterium]